MVNSLVGSTSVVELRKVHMVNSLVGSTSVCRAEESTHGE